MGHVMMPTAPSTRFVMIHSEFTLADFERRLHRPAHPADTHELVPRTVYWGIAEIKLHLRLRTERAAEDRPTAWAGQFVAHRRDAQERKLCHQQPLATFLNHAAVPESGGQLRQQFTHFL